MLINRKNTLNLIVSVLLSLNLFSCTAKGAKSSKPNIVIIYTDDQGYGDVSALNPEAKFKTPNMDKIANEGIIFTDGHSSDAVCTPSRYSLLTGRYSWRTRLKENVIGADGPCLIEKDRMTIATLLKSEGYNTAMVGKWHLQMEFAGDKGKDRDWSQPFTEGPIEHGFDYFFGLPASMNFGILTFLENDHVLEAPSMYTKKKMDVTPRTYRMTPPYKKEISKGYVEVAPSFNDELVLEKFAEKAVAYINKSAKDAKEGKPFFLYFPMTSPHLPHCTHPDFQGRSECGNYGDFMEETDYRVGQVLDALKENGLEENTLVIFSSDNGAESNCAYQRDTYQHYSCMNFKGGKRDIYEGGHRVPFLMRWPEGLKAGMQINNPVCQVDYLATIAEIVGADIPEYAGEDSYSLYPLMVNNTKTKYDSERPVIHHSFKGYMAIRQGKWKLNLVRGSGGSLAPVLIIPAEGEAKYELYDIENDPSESTNLYFEHPEIVKELEAKMAEIITSGRSTAGAPQDYIKENWEQINWMTDK